MKELTRRRLDLSREMIVHGVEQLLIEDTRKALNYLEHIDSVVSTLDLEKTEALKGEKGEQGNSPLFGIDYYTKDEIQEVIDLVKAGVKDGYTPIKGKDYFTKEELEEVKQTLIKSIPEPVKEQNLNEEEILKLVNKRIEEIEKKFKKDSVIFDPAKQEYYQVAGTGVSAPTAIWGNITGTLSDQTDLQTALNTKQDTLVSGTNIKTINGVSVLGPGDIPLPNGTSIQNITSDTTFTLSDGETVFLVDTLGENVNITLAAVAANTGKYTVTRVNSSTGTLTIIGTVNGVTNPTIDFVDESWTMVSNGTNYQII